MKPLLAYAGKRKVLIYVAIVLAAVSQLMALAPFLCIWAILRDVIAVAPDFSRATDIAHYGWMAVGFAIGSIILYLSGLMCSHLCAFRVAECGTPAALAASGGFYARMQELQRQAQDWNI